MSDTERMREACANVCEEVAAAWRRMRGIKGYSGGIAADEIRDRIRAIAVPEQAPEISAPNATREAVHDAIARHIAPSEILGNIAWHEDEWRAMVAVTPSGPLQLRAFRVIVKPK